MLVAVSADITDLVVFIELLLYPCSNMDNKISTKTQFVGFEESTPLFCANETNLFRYVLHCFKVLVHVKT